jgi:hypothetical protein
MATEDLVIWVDHEHRPIDVPSFPSGQTEEMAAINGYPHSLRSVLAAFSLISGVSEINSIHIVKNY